MKYLLDEDEYNSLIRENRELKNILNRLPEEEELQKFATKIANEFILTEGWMKGKPWNCILTVDYEWHCDDCPAQEICPYKNKSWSK